MRRPNRPFKKSVVLEPSSVLTGEYAVMTKCDGVFVSLSARRGECVVRDADRRVLFTFSTRLDFNFFIYADMIGDRFFAYDVSLDANFFDRHAALVASAAGEERVVIVRPYFTSEPREHLHLAPPVQGAPSDGVVLVSVDDSTPHYKWKPVHTADFVVTRENKCLVGWLACDPLPFPWCKPECRIDSTYMGIAFGDEDGPHRFEGSGAEHDTVVECVFKPPDTWVRVRDRHDKTLQFIRSPAVFSGANSWKTALSVLVISRCAARIEDEQPL